MRTFPIDAPKRRVISALERLGFRIVREAEHIAMLREDADGTRTPTLRAICRQSGIARDDFLAAYNNS